MAVLFHRLGEIRDRTFENQRYRASGLNLAVAAIILWNTVYLSRTVAELRSQGEIVSDDLLAHVAPLGWEHMDPVLGPLLFHFPTPQNPRSEPCRRARLTIACGSTALLRVQHSA
jgi:hypothetical protein